MRIGVVGGRDFDDYLLMEETLNTFISRLIIPEDITIVSGYAVGADIMSEEYAHNHNYETLIFPPDFRTHGYPAAYFVRNSQIVDNSDVLFAFWDGKSTGTKDSVNKANKRKIPVHIINY